MGGHSSHPGSQGGGRGGLLKETGGNGSPSGPDHPDRQDAGISHVGGWWGRGGTSPHRLHVVWLAPVGVPTPGAY